MLECIEVDPSHPDSSVIAQAATLIKGGGIVAFPTETVYGLAANALSEKSITRVFQIKGRDHGRPIPILIDTKEALWEFVTDVPQNAENLMNQFWPGGLTIIFKASHKIPSLLMGNSGKIGVRISNCTAAWELVKEVGAPITTTSANISGAENCSTAFEVYKSLGRRIDMIIDGGKTVGYLGSTVVDVTQNPAKIIREGIIQSKDLMEYL